jgi:transposase InsO family protein
MARRPWHDTGKVADRRSRDRPESTAEHALWIARTHARAAHTVSQFQRFALTCKDHRLMQKYITPCRLEQNSIDERFFRTLNEECSWLHDFTDLAHAGRKVIPWLHRHNTQRSHAALGQERPTG